MFLGVQDSNTARTIYWNVAGTPSWWKVFLARVARMTWRKVVCGLWSMVRGLSYVVGGLWSVVCGVWSVVCGLSSVVAKEGPIKVVLATFQQVVPATFRRRSGVFRCSRFEHGQNNLLERRRNTFLVENFSGPSGPYDMEETGLWSVVYGPRSIVRGWWSVVCGLWCVVCGLWSLWSVLCGRLPVMSGLWCVVCGLWSVVCCLWCVVGDLGSEVCGL